MTYIRQDFTAASRSDRFTAVNVGRLVKVFFVQINPLTPNDPYSGRTAPLTSKIAFYIFIQQI